LRINTDEDVAVLQYHWRTTGVPKGAMLTHYNIFANVDTTDMWAHPSTRRGEDCYLLVIPLFHIYGFTVGMLDSRGFAFSTLDVILRNSTCCTPRQSLEHANGKTIDVKQRNHSK